MKHFEDNIPWYELFRPKTFDTIIGNKQIIEILKTLKSPCNLLFHGRSGVGKTLSIECLINKLKSPHATYNESVMEINTSDERNVMENIKEFVSKKSVIQLFIIIEEIDTLSSGLQHALCSIMDNNEKIFFIFSCTETAYVIEKIHSRCIFFYFKQIDMRDIRDYVIRFLTDNDITFDETGVNHIIALSNGDMRNVMNNLQMAYYGCGNIILETVRKIIKTPLLQDIISILNECINKNLNGAINKMKSLQSSNYDSNDIVVLIYNFCKSDDFKIDYEIKLKCIECVGNAHVRIIDGCEGFIQLTALICRLYLIFN